MKIVITGASSGIGEALAKHYAARGATLALIARRKSELDRLAGVLPGLTSPKGAGRHAVAVPSEARDGAAPHTFVYPLDVTDAEALKAAAADFIAKAGVPDLVIGNAGISVGTVTEEAGDLAAFERVLAVNVTGLFNTFQPFIAPMRTAGFGTLAGIASVAGIRGLPGAGAYCASKAAAISYLESLRGELRGSGVKVVTVAPGYIETPMTAQNPYPMPFILPVDEAARRIARVIDYGSSYAVVPWQMAIVAKLLRLLPNPLFDAILSGRGRKPRSSAT
ncbi:MAG: SDR family oxidoreductase [Gammaproteobacteria bacterium]|nr:SDR family oxidoreductase [Gammaproteobacteria bacterium]MBU1416233.1 SDR family oxidoreductase [Gammaproteobacteria bacterium]